MNNHPARIAAAIVLGTGTFVVGVAALAIVFAKLLVDAGLPIHPADLATLDDVIAILPFVLTFAAVGAVATIGLVAGQAWAERAAIADAVVGVTAGAFGLFLIVAGRDPFASSSRASSVADGVGIVGTFTVVYLAVLALIVADRVASRRSAQSAA